MLFRSPPRPSKSKRRQSNDLALFDRNSRRRSLDLVHKLLGEPGAGESLVVGREEERKEVEVGREVLLTMKLLEVDGVDQDLREPHHSPRRSSSTLSTPIPIARYPRSWRSQAATFVREVSGVASLATESTTDVLRLCAKED